jgi:UDP-GlcNAc:undecaprenyl-phosphate/decaprenyl-phosphate GlcNAc-1-phosphate transferase
MVYLSTLLMSLFVTIALIPILIRAATHFHLVDMPDARKVHATPIPRSGGIAIALGACIPIIVWQDAGQFIWAYLAGAGVLVAVGIADDYRSLDYRIKFAGQIVAAGIMVVLGDIRITSLGALLPENVLLPDWVAVPLTLFSIVAVTNAINLSDGLDGLAGGLCLLSLCCIGYLAYLVENMMVVFLSVSLAGAVFGFLRFNTFPATLFMGDTGSTFLGFSVITLSLAITQGSTPLSALLPLIVVGLPVMDTAAVVCERMAHGRSPFVADKNHFHHKLLRMGLFHTESVMAIYVLQGMLVSAAIFYRFYDDGFLLAVYIVFFIMVLSIYFGADHFHWQIRRTGFMDRKVKGRLRALKERGIFIKIAFSGLEKGLPLLLLVTCLGSENFPKPMLILSAFLLAILLLTWFFRKTWLRNTLPMTLYLFIPFVVYASNGQTASWIDVTVLEKIYHLLYLGLVFFVIATLKLTKRRRGFRVSPMDFLILFIALLAPLVTGTYLKEKVLAETVGKTLMMFFSYEVLIGELREKFGWLAVATGTALVVVMIRS